MGGIVRKRGRSVSKMSKRARFTRGTYKTNDVRRIWPKASLGVSQRYDPFPARQTATFRYSTVVTLVNPVGSAITYLMRANSIFDPDFTGIGYQPYGHDQYQTIYNHYKVKSAVCTMTPTEGDRNGIYGITMTDDTTVGTGYDNVRNQKGTKMSVLSLRQGSNSSVVQDYKIHETFPVDTDGLGANFGANPSEGAYFTCWYEGANQSLTQSLSFLITVTYVAEMWELKDLGNS